MALLDIDLERVVQALVDQFVISVEQLEEGRIVARSWGIRIGDALIELGFVTTRDLAEATAVAFGCNHVNLQHPICQTLLDLLPGEVARKYEVVPVVVSDEVRTDVVTLAMENPNDLETIEKLRFALEREIRTVAASRQDILDAIDRNYGMRVVSHDVFDAPAKLKTDLIRDISHLTSRLTESFRPGLTTAKIDAAARTVFGFARSTHISPNNDSVMSQHVYDWIATLNDQPVNDEGKATLLHQFAEHIVTNDCSILNELNALYHDHDLNSCIFISYRRDDCQETTWRMYDRLEAEFGQAAVFIDLDAIPAGADYRAHIEMALGQTRVLVAMIGPSWLDARDKRGQRRIDHANDLVRLEIELAMANRIPVIPVLAGTARMPTRELLPETLRELTGRNAIRLRPARDFKADANRLVKAIRDIVEDPHTTTSESN